MTTHHVREPALAPVAVRRTLLLPWPMLGTAVGVVAAVAGVMVAFRPDDPPDLLVRMAQLALGGVGAYVLDDAAAALTGVAPRSAWRRRVVAVTTGGGAVTAAWAAVLVLAGTAGRLPVGLLTLEVATLLAVSTALGAVRWRHGEAEPGGLVALVVALAGVTALLVEPFLHHGLFPSTAEAGGGRITLVAVWVAAATISVAVLAWAGGDPTRSVRLRSRPAHRH